MVILLLLPLLACAVSDPCPEVPMLDGAEGLVVTEAEHGIGWGRAECYECHQADTLHRTGCTPDVDLEAIQAEVEATGTGSCAACHGANGASP